MIDHINWLVPELFQTEDEPYMLETWPTCRLEPYESSARLVGWYTLVGTPFTTQQAPRRGPCARSWLVHHSPPLVPRVRPCARATSKVLEQGRREPRAAPAIAAPRRSGGARQLGTGKDGKQWYSVVVWSSGLTIVLLFTYSVVTGLTYGDEPCQVHL